MIEPIVIEPIIQKTSGDCAVACLAMFLGKPYADILRVIPKRTKVNVNGLSTQQIRNVGKRLGINIEYRRVEAEATLPDDDEFGVLDLQCLTEDSYHVALHLKGGNILDPASGFIYTDLAAFLLAKNWEVCGFYWREK